MPHRAYVSVNTLSPGERLPSWRNMISRHLGQNMGEELEHDPGRWAAEGGAPFTGSLEFGALGNGFLCRMVAAPHRFVRPAVELSTSHPSPLMLLMQQKPVSFFEQSGRTGQLAPGDWCLLDTGRPFALHNPSGCDQIVLTLPPPEDAALADLVVRGSAKRCDGRGGSARLVQTILREAYRQFDRVPAHATNTLVDAICGMAWNALQEFSDPSASDLHQSAHLLRIKQFIENHLADPELSPDRVAQGCGCSVRSVYRAFAEEHMGSPMDHIWHRRVAQCASAMRNPANDKQSITEIALAWGFSSSSHFSRTFKQSLGVSPKLYRTQH
ncbi:MAG: helix-turn-helix domain-containing protein [Rhodoferax sp.]|uniref:helix-turn-helix domain-containing protein n=1 Tax=Rhodoferax sp. TaxID=50421 RepID=UPI002ACE69E1|nr:helix-turn-helix domain-containing protein [Rhodoferax sp.]MDZ7892798.1 helix-turn-helix domain-containing protein [Rhodoferax sp.]